MSNAMCSATSSLPSTDAALESLRDELKGNVFRNVKGFFAKYFEAKPWSSVVEKKLRETKSERLLNCVPDIAQYDLLVEWISDFETLFFTEDQANYHLRIESSNPTDISPWVIHLGTGDRQSVAGSTRVFGELHRGSLSPMADDDVTLRFCQQAQQLFKAQSARCFLHGFLIRDTTLELWTFDRSGAYSSERLDLTQRRDMLARTLAGYALMSDEEAGFNTFIKHLAPGSDNFITLDQNSTFYTYPELIATADYIVGPGTTCYQAARSAGGEPDTVIKFSWREDEELTEVRLLKRASERNAWGVVQLLGYQDLKSIASLRQGLDFPQPFANRTFSCIATTPLGRPIRQYTSIPELLEVLRDIVKALQALYLNARILHRDIAIKNLIIAPQHSADSPKGILLDFNMALDLDHVRSVEPMVGSDGFMAIGILFGQRHTYRHDLESLFYVFLWMAITNDRVHDEANDILNGIPKTSRLWKWCTMDFFAVGRDKAADMSPKGFEGILDEFSSDFAPLRSLAKELHGLIFSVREGEIFTGTETYPVAIEELYNGMANAFHRSALAFQG